MKSLTKMNAPRLKIIDLSVNRITYFERLDLLFVNRLERLNMDSNQLSCLNDLVKINNFINNGKVLICIFMNIKVTIGL